MALWQFDVHFVPAQAQLPTLKDEGWVLPLLPDQFIQDACGVLSARMGSPWMMCEGIYVFGNEVGSRVDLVPDVTVGAELLARIDARAESIPFCEFLCELALRIDCKFLAPELQISIEPRRQALVDALMRSRSWSYAVAPAEALRRLADLE